ncbi:hypothetical protein GGR52DRAFT_388866 [Hypoxylon sp. FL1284]|nr:hypothetical protein GGR52DRAFT_388866 [Hypoxylon sp. FL1284]
MLGRRSSGKSPLQVPPLPSMVARSTTLSGLLYQDTADKAFKNECGGGINQFSAVSTADTFDVFDQRGGIVTNGLDDDQIRKWLKPDSKPARLRVLFLDGLPEQPDQLPITESLLRDVFSAFETSARFTDNLARQHMPGREVHRVGDIDVRHEMWYTAVLRGVESVAQLENRNQKRDFIRRIAYWQRFVMWSAYRLQKDTNEVGSATTVYMIWRCPLDIKRTFFSTFSGENGLKLLYHPMIVHAFMIEKIGIHTYDYLARIADPLYKWESKASELRTPDDYTVRSRAFLALSRQLHQISTDYDILTVTAQITTIPGIIEVPSHVTRPVNQELILQVNRFGLDL